MGDNLKESAGIEAQSDDTSEAGLSRLDVEALCTFYGEDYASVVGALRKNTALTRLLRKAFGLSADGRVLNDKPIGRPAQDSQHRRDKFVVSCLIHEGASVEKAFALAAEIRGKEGRRGKDGKPITPEGLRSAVRRRPKALADVFGDTERPVVDALPEGLERLRIEMAATSGQKSRAEF